MKTSIPVINCLRGIAAMVVCSFHFVSMTANYFSTPVQLLFVYGRAGIHLFFVISGVVVPLSMIRARYGLNQAGKFLLKRTIRIEPPYLLALLLAVIYLYLRREYSVASEVDFMPSTRDLLLHIGYLVPVVDGDWATPVFWTLSIEFQYYLLLALLFPLALGGTKERMLFYVLFLAGPYLTDHFAFAPNYLPLFLVGILYALQITDRIDKREYFAVTILALAVTFHQFLLYEALVVLGTILVVQLAPNFSTRPLLFLGKISFSLYLLHAITGTPLINILSHHFRETWQKPLVVLAGYVFSIGVAFIFYRWVELPSLRWSKSVRLQT